MGTNDKRLLNSQVYVFLHAIRTYNQSSSSYERWLEEFVKTTKANDAMQIDSKHVDFFLQAVYDNYNGYFPRIQARRAVEGLQRYYMARGKNARTRPKGRPPAIDKMAKVMEYKSKGLSFRDVAKLLDSDVSLVYRWFKKGVSQA